MGKKDRTFNVSEENLRVLIAANDQEDLPFTALDLRNIPLLDLLHELGMVDVDYKFSYDSADGEERNIPNCTWLMLEATNDMEWFIDWLLSKGANPTLTNKNGETAADYAKGRRMNQLAAKLRAAEDAWHAKEAT